MSDHASIWIFVAVGAVSGVASGIFGIGGGVLIVPGLIYLAGFTQHRAAGTSLAVLLPPIGLAATLEYYRHGNVDIGAALIMATLMFAGGWVGAVVAQRMSARICDLRSDCSWSRLVFRLCSGPCGD
jgi:uncharacterized protein